MLSMKKYLREIYRRKDLLVYLVFSGLKAEHRNSFLGYFWWVLDPLFRVAIFYFVRVVLTGRSGPDLVGNLIIGLIAWRWFSSTMSRSSKAITGKAGIVSKVYLPKVIFPVTTSLTQMMNFVFAITVIVGYLIISRTVPGPVVLWLPFIMIIQYLLMLALSLVISYWSVFIRDIENLLKHFTRLWFYASPVIWERSLLERSGLPEQFLLLVDGNPAAIILNSYRNIFLRNENPFFESLLVIGGISLVIIVFMTYFYSRNEHKMIKLL